MTFLEQERCDVEITPNAELPSKPETDLGSCDICPSWAFNSKTERDRHYSFSMQKKAHYCQRIQKRERSKQHLIARFSYATTRKTAENAVEHFLPITN